MLIFPVHKWNTLTKGWQLICASVWKCLRIVCVCLVSLWLKLILEVY